MKVWTDREGKQLTAKEFMERWKGGIEKVSPLQQLRMTLLGYWIVLAGILVGVVTAWSARAWWLLIVLVGSLFVSGMATLGSLQKYLLLNKIEKEMKGGLQNEKQEGTV